MAERDYTRPSPATLEAAARGSSKASSDTAAVAAVSSTDPPPQPRDTQSVKADTSYVVLRQREGAVDGVWVELATTTGRDPESSLRAYIDELEPESQPGTWVVVASKFWKPQSVRPEVVTTLIFEDA